MQDDKYVVFKREEWEAWTQKEIEATIRLGAGTPEAEPLPSYPRQVADAVVIRCQDVFAPPALDAYGNAILCVIEALKDKIASDDSVYERMSALQDIADYFHRRASEAWQIERKLPD